MPRKRPNSSGSEPAGRASFVREAESLGPRGTEAVALAAAKDLSGDLDLDSMAVVFNLMRAQARVMQDLETYVHRPAGMTWAGFRMLYLILAFGPLAPQELAGVLHVSAASVSAVLNTLERYELVQRTRVSRDGRVVTVQLTEFGETVTKELAHRNNQREIEWAAGLSPNERKTLVRLLRKIISQQPSPPDSVGEKLIDVQTSSPEPSRKRSSRRRSAAGG